MDVDLSRDFAPATTFGTIGSFISVITQNIFTIAGLITLILLIFGGFSYIVSAGSGDAKQLEKGKKAITSALIGLVLIFCSFWIIQLLEIVLGIKIL